jgi:hypothetical protein
MYQRIRHDRVPPLAWLASVRSKWRNTLGSAPLAADFYDYYLEEGTDSRKWNGEVEEVLGTLEAAGVSVGSGQRVLDVSGEPGFVCRAMRERGLDAWVTAYSSVVSDRIREKLNVPAFTFDYAAKDLAETWNRLNGKLLDLVLVRYSIGFCEDLEAFTSAIASITQSSAAVLVSYPLPSRAVCLRWMCDDYTYLRLWTPEQVRQAFADSGFRQLHTEERPAYDYLWKMSGLQKWLIRWYAWTESGFRGLSDYQRRQHQIAVVFRKS